MTNTRNAPSSMRDRLNAANEERLRRERDGALKRAIAAQQTAACFVALSLLEAVALVVMVLS